MNMVKNMKSFSLKGWRDSASAIIVAKDVFQSQNACDGFNYKVLTLKRSAKSKFMPGTHVYPGGNCSKSDTSPSWLTLYNDFGINKDGLGNVKYFNQKITAIRETFEETGILICRSKKEKCEKDLSTTPWASYVGGAEIKKWQNRVHDNADDFLTLCKEFEVYPDVWSLKEWANWITPPAFKQRFNTLFFLAVFLEMPAVQAEESEVQSLEWNTPVQLLLSNRQENVILPPPQFYETSRLLNFKKIEDLADYAHNKPKEILPIFPYRVTTEEGTYSIYPGDDLYPKEMDAEKTEMDHFEKLPDSKVQHRTLHKTMSHNEVIINNFNPPKGHILPLDFQQHKL